MINNALSLKPNKRSKIKLLIKIVEVNLIHTRTNVISHLLTIIMDALKIFGPFAYILFLLQPFCLKLALFQLKTYLNTFFRQH